MTFTFKYLAIKYAVIGLGAAFAASACLDAAFAKDTHTQHHKQRVHRAAAAVPPGQPAYRAWNGADPTRGPGTAQLRAYQNAGRCVIDEGYGRWSACSNE